MVQFRPRGLEQQRKKREPAPCQKQTSNDQHRQQQNRRQVAYIDEAKRRDVYERRKAMDPPARREYTDGDKQKAKRVFSQRASVTLEQDDIRELR